MPLQRHARWIAARIEEPDAAARKADRRALGRQHLKPPCLGGIIHQHDGRRAAPHLGRQPLGERPISGCEYGGFIQIRPTGHSCASPSSSAVKNRSACTVRLAVSDDAGSRSKPPRTSRAASMNSGGEYHSLLPLLFATCAARPLPRPPFVGKQRDLVERRCNAARLTLVSLLSSPLARPSLHSGQADVQ